MSGLSRWLVLDRERPELDGGEKTPAFIEVPLDPSMDMVVLSSPQGNYEVRSRDVQEEELQTLGAFDLPSDPEAEDIEQARICKFLYLAGARRDWGNVVMRDAIDAEFAGQAESYFDTFDLDVEAIHAGADGCRSMIEQELVDPSTGTLSSDVDEETLQQLMDEEYAVGKVDGYPLFYNPHLGPLTVFSAAPEYVGIAIRIRERVAILIHNPERGVAIAKLEHEHRQADNSSGEETSDG